MATTEPVMVAEELGQMVGQIASAIPFMSPRTDQIAAALSDAQGEFEIVSKTANNPFFKSRYAPLPDVVKSATPILATHGLAVWQGPDHDTEGDLLWTVLLHKSGQYIGSAMRMRPVKNDSQAQGSAITYARRYAYMSALGLVADEDDDANRASDRVAAPKRKSTKQHAAETPQEGDGDTLGHASDEKLAEIRALHKRSQINAARMRQIISDAGGSKLAELTEDQADVVKLALLRIVKSLDDGGDDE